MQESVTSQGSEATPKGMSRRGRAVMGALVAATVLSGTLNPIRILGGTVVGYWGGVVVIILLLWILRGKDEWEATIARWFNARWIRGVALGLACSTPIIPLTVLLHGSEGVSFSGWAFLLAAQVVTSTVVGAVAEEVVHRGVLFGVLWRDVRVSKWLAILISALVFAEAHRLRLAAVLPPMACLFAFIGQTLFGGFACWVFARRDEDLCLPIGFHVGWNLSGAVLFPSSSEAVLDFSRVAAIQLCVWLVTLTIASIALHVFGRGAVGARGTR